MIRDNELETCRTCRCWQRYDGEGQDDRLGACRLHPPVIVDTTSRLGRSTQPETSDVSWCGDWREWHGEPEGIKLELEEDEMRDEIDIDIIEAGAITIEGSSVDTKNEE